MLIINNHLKLPVAACTLPAYEWPCSSKDTAYTDAERSADINVWLERIRPQVARLSSLVRKPWATKAGIRAHRLNDESISVTVTEPIGSLLMGEVVSLTEPLLRKTKAYCANNVRNSCYVTSECVEGMLFNTPITNAVAAMYQLELFLQGRNPSTLKGSDAEQYAKLAEALEGNLAKYGPGWLDVTDAIVLKGDHVFAPRYASTSTLEAGDGARPMTYAEVIAEVPALDVELRSRMERAQAHYALFSGLRLDDLPSEDLLLTDLTAVPWVRVNASARLSIALNPAETRLLAVAPHALRGIIPAMMARTERESPMTNLQWANGLYYYAKGLSRLAGLKPNDDATAVASSITISSFVDYATQTELIALNRTEAALFESLCAGRASVEFIADPSTVEEARATQFLTWWLQDNAAPISDLTAKGIAVDAGFAAPEALFTFTVTGKTMVRLRISGMAAGESITATHLANARSALAALDQRIQIVQCAAQDAGDSTVTLIDGGGAVLEAPVPLRNILQNQYANLCASAATLVTPYMAG